MNKDLLKNGLETHDRWQKSPLQSQIAAHSFVLFVESLVQNVVSTFSFTFFNN